MKAASSDTLTRLLDTAQDLIQRRGLNAMSFQDLSEAVGIRKASVHYHFPSKDDMVVALLKRYRESFARKVQPILDTPSTSTSGAEKLKRYAALFVETLRKAPHDRGCPCGMLAAEICTLSGEAVDLLHAFF